MGAHKLTKKPPRWQASALAIAAALALGLTSSSALALALGRVTVQSALGEPLRADIEIPEINAEETATLRAAVASPDAFRAAGLEYNAAMANVQITLQKRTDGRMFLRLTSDRVINEPFIDVILEANWSSGRIVRDYTLLFDPPSLRPAAASAPVVAQVPPVAAMPAPAPAPVAPSRAAPSPAGQTTAPVPRPSAAAPRPAPAPVAAPIPAPGPRPAQGDAKKVTVQAGDTAGRIAATNKPAAISLDQMLMALLSANPDAFIGGNINRIKAGAVLDIPTSEQAALIEASEASRTVVAQSRDFNEFRRKLAEGVPTTQVAAADRQASGKLQARVEEKKPAAATPDKLTLSKGSVQAKAGEDKIAKERESKEAAARVAELNKNIAELAKLGSATGASATLPVPAGVASAPKSAGVAVPTGALIAASAPKPAASAPAAVVPAPVVAAAKNTATAAVAAAAPVPAATASAPASPPVAASVSTAASAPATAPVSAPASTASTPTIATASPAVAAAPSVAAPASAAPVAAAPKVVAKPPPAPTPEPSLIDDLLGNPLIPAGGAGLVALLAAFGIYRAHQRKKSTQVDSSFLESRLQPDSFFGASGGQRVDTNEGGATGSSMVYSPSQLDAAGDVDPVAEADVYLAYGRDLQAEEILKEALRTTPQRVAIHGKLLEIYAKRRDAKAFEFVATEAYTLTRGEGPDWEHICELGLDLDPANSLYRPGGQPVPGGASPAGAVATASVGDFAMATAKQMLPQQMASAAPSVDLDLDLDFSIGDDPPDSPPLNLQATMPMQIEPTVAFTAAPPEAPALDMDFGSATVAIAPTALPDLPSFSAASEAPVRLSAPDLTLSENDLSFSLESFSTAPEPAPVSVAVAPVTPPVAAKAAPADSGMIEFDLGSLSLDLGTPQADAPADTGSSALSTGFDDTGSDPLSTKLALAEEFSAIGDPDGARSLAEEVVAEASGALKAKAQRFLAELA